MSSTSTSETPCVIEVTRERPVFSGLLSGGWRVFIDGVWVGQAPRGKPVRFPVAPGTHTVRVWTRRGGSCSNDVILDMTPGTLRTLRCGSSTPPLGISQLPAQVDAIRTMAKEGAAIGALHLYEDAGLLTE